MIFLDVTLPTVAANLALDEALLDEAECGMRSEEILRLWEPQSVAVVLGRSSRVADEVNEIAAAAERIPILRRSSGGSAVVIAPGCLAYSLLLSYDARPSIRMLDVAHRFVMEKMIDTLKNLNPCIQFAGTSDLVIDGRKISGNSVRCRRDWMLYHGTLLLDMNLSLIDRYLKHPPREPEYRQHRPHGDFVENFGMSYAQVAENLKPVWNCSTGSILIPHARIEELLDQKYTNRKWNYQR